MEGREHAGVVLAMNASGDPATADRWDAWYAEERWPKSTAFDGCTGAALFQIFEGHTVPGDLTHAAVYETGRTPPPAALDELRANLADTSGADELRASRAHLGSYSKIAEYGDGTGKTAAGILIVLCDALDPTQEPEFHEWYDHHGPYILENMDYYAATRYVADDPGPWQAGQLTIYETTSDDVGRVFSEGYEWYMSLPPAELAAPVRLWWERPFGRRA